MRYPTMTRVFAVFLALASFMLLLSGGFGIYKTLERKGEDEAELQSILDKAEEYRELNLKLAGQLPYKEEKSLLEEKEELYRDGNSEHRKELSQYSLTKSGLKMGTDALDEAQAALNAGRAEFEAGLAEFEKKEAEFNAGYEQYLAGKEALRQGREMYELSVQGINAAKQALDALEGMEGLLESDDPQARYELSLQICADTLAAFDGAAAALDELCAKGIISPEQAQEIENQIIAETGMSSQELRAQVQGSYDALLAGDPEAGLSEEQFQQFKARYEANKVKIHAYAAAVRAAIGAYEPELQKQKEQLDAMEAELQKLEPMMEEGKKAIEEGRAMMESAGAALDEADAKLYGSRTLIWYELGQLEEQFLELQLEKAELEGDNEELEQLRAELEERKKLENRRTSLSVELREYPEIKALYESDTELYEAARQYAGDFAESIKLRNTLEYTAEALMLLTGLLGFGPLFSFFGKERKRSRRLIMPGIVLALSAAALIFGFGAGFGLFKSVLVVLISALAVLLSAVPNKIKKDILAEV